MDIRLLFFCLSFLSAMACGTPSQNPTSGTTTPSEPNATAPIETLVGLFYVGSSTNYFRDCNTGKTYFLKDETHSLDTLYPRFVLQPTYPNEPAFAVLQGKIGAATSADFDGTLTVSRVDSVDFLNFMNCCESYDFWCSGTEPFWDLQIFPPDGDGSIVFREISGEHVFVFPSVRPVVKGETWTYISKNQQGETIQAVLRKGKANNGMSEMEYHYSCEVTVGKEKFRGVAIRFGEKPTFPD